MRGEIEKRRLTRFVYDRNLLHEVSLSLADLCTLQLHLYFLYSFLCHQTNTKDIAEQSASDTHFVCFIAKTLHSMALNSIIKNTWALKMCPFE